MNDTFKTADVSLKDYWQVLVRRRWVVVSFCFISTAAVAIASVLMTPLYRATTSIVVEGEDTSVLTGYESSGTQGMSFDIYENYVQTQMAIIKSRNVAGKVFEEFKLVEHPRYRESEDPVKMFLQDVYLERIKNTRVINISVENPDPKLAADLVNRLVETYAQDNLIRRSLAYVRNQRMASLNAEFLRLQAKYDSLSNQFGPKHPEMVALREEIRTMSKRIQNERFGGQGAGEEGRQRSEDQVLLEDILLQIQENSVLSSSRMNNIIITDRAIVPTKKAKPKRLLNTLIGFAGGLMGGIFLAFFIDYLDDSIKTEEDVKRYIGNISFLGSTFNEKGSDSKSNIDHVVSLRSESPSAEAYRLIRMGILWFGRQNAVKDFAVSSAGPSEGKTTVASNLAISLAEVNFKVLLVDADIRKGRIHESYGLSGSEGLASVLTDSLPLDKVIQKTEIKNLSIVACGHSVIDSSRLIGSPKMTEFIQKTRSQFDFIIYDTPPLNIISDTAGLIPQLDGVLLTLRSGVTGNRMLTKAFSIIKDSNAKLIGVVFNAMDPINKRAYREYYKRH